MTSIFNVLANSPVGTLKEHMNKVQACIETLLPFFEAVFNEDWSKAKTLFSEVASLEKEADNIRRRLRLDLPRALFLSISRADLFKIIQGQDMIANKAEDIAGIVYGRRMKIPTVMRVLILDSLKCGINASAQSQKAVYALAELLSTSFGGNQIKALKKIIVHMNKLENDSDSLQIKARKKLYRIEADLSPVDVMFLYQLIKTIAEIADCAQVLAGLFQLSLAR